MINKNQRKRREPGSDRTNSEQIRDGLHVLIASLLFDNQTGGDIRPFDNRLESIFGPRVRIVERSIATQTDIEAQ
jgi:hypothetical protein